MDIVAKIIQNVLKALYQPFWFSVLLSVLAMFFIMFAKEQGWKTLLKKWLRNFKSSVDFRKEFLLIFYTTMILFRTLLNRDMWANPLADVIGKWWIYDANGELTTEIFENTILFIPFVILLLWTFKDKLIKNMKWHNILWMSVKSVFLFSLAIEFLQLFLRLGTFQLSDLFYNTLGGLVGGIIYFIGYKIAEKRKGKQ